MRSDEAATYTRSSKDRSDVSPAAQIRALEDLAASRSLSITARFEDAVESGATEDRPGFQSLLRAIKDPRRTWRTLLVYDTSRIARRRHIAQAFKHELKRRGIALLYVTRPADVDPVSEIMLDSMFEAMDEVHSMMSRTKGLAGMAENVRQGWRAGGRAPAGYRLEHTPTGAVREGKPVTKSRLMPGDNAAQVRQYLTARAAGTPRQVARAEASLDISEASLVGIEWNALTYAGFTVWNVHQPSGSGTKRRPRAEWHTKAGTHEALITEREAESILARLETSNISAAIRSARAASSRFLLSGVLYTTDGRAWNGHGAHYRLRKVGGLPGRIIRAEVLDEAVTETLHAFRTSDRYLAWLKGEVRRDQSGAVEPSGAASILADIRRLERERDRAAQLALGEDDGGAYQGIVRQRTRQIDALRRELDAVEREASAAPGLQALTIDGLRSLIDAQDPVRVVRQLIDRVILEPTLDCQLKLRTSYNSLWRAVASPGGHTAQTQGVMLPVALRLRASGA